MLSCSCGIVPLRLISVGCLLVNAVVGERLEDHVGQATIHSNNEGDTINQSDASIPSRADLGETPDFPRMEAPHGGSSQDPPERKHRPVGLLQESGQVVSAARHRQKGHATGAEGFHGEFEGHFDGHFLGDFHGDMDGHFEGMFSDR
eukprot:TRINITY_DN57031_c0_g1_i1.p1 TRINITY_DN57031_c0_g1~~TRINITY_DN57031_c0_g1_i1.p1  ORF type:complete len:147 (-),score=13.54 TRINITY_DN57031_c0_g1_i1:127-567(-)